MSTSSWLGVDASQNEMTKIPETTRSSSLMRQYLWVFASNIERVSELLWIRPVHCKAHWVHGIRPFAVDRMQAMWFRRDDSGRLGKYRGIPAPWWQCERHWSVVRQRLEDSISGPRHIRHLKWPEWKEAKFQLSSRFHSPITNPILESTLVRRLLCDVMKWPKDSISALTSVFLFLLWAIWREKMLPFAEKAL